MKAKPAQIDALQKQICSTFKAALIHGADFGIVEDCAQRIIKMIVPQKDDFSLIKLNKAQLKENPARLLDEGNMASFLGGRKLIWLKEVDNSVLESVENYLKYIQTDTFLLLTGDALQKSSSLRGVAESAPDVLEIACYNDDAKDSRLLISSYLSERGYLVGGDVLNLLSERLIENRIVTQSELEKLITYLGNKKQISVSDVDAVIPKTEMATFDELCHAVALGKQEEADKICRNLLANGETVVSIIRILIMHFNKILLAVDLFESGISKEDVLKKVLRANQFKQKDIMASQIYLWKKPFLAKVLQLLLETEKQSKTTELPAELMLERAITAIAGIPKKIRRL